MKKEPKRRPNGDKLYELDWRDIANIVFWTALATWYITYRYL